MGMMGFLASTWRQFQDRKKRDNVEYSLVSGSLSGILHDEVSETRSINDGPLVSWRTSPAFEIHLNLDKVRQLVVPSLVVLLPSFVRLSARKPVRKLYPTSYLDGLRGVAALFVLLHHYALTYTSSSARGWRPDDAKNHWFLQLPMIRIIHSGKFMVAIFFVISGYVLSYRGLKLAREGQPAQLLDSLASSVFRRWLRLHLPVIISTFIAFVMARYSLWGDMPDGWEHYSEYSYHIHKEVPLPVMVGPFSIQLRDWYEDTKHLCDPFRYGADAVSRYNVNVLWTIPLEWMGSMLVFMTVLGLARTKTWVKFVVLSGLIYFCHSTTRWAPAIFLSGILLAELSLVYSNRLKPSESPELTEKGPSTGVSRHINALSRIFWTLTFLLGLHMGSHPQDGASITPGYMTLMSYIPAQYERDKEVFWLSIGSVIVVLALENAPYLQRVFTTRIAQYLGDISFSLYMLHSQVLYTMGSWLVPKCMNLTGGWANGQLGFVTGVLMAMLILLPFTFWISDVFSRLVDEKCVKFARWMSSECFIKTE